MSTTDMSKLTLEDGDPSVTDKIAKSIKTILDDAKSKDKTVLNDAVADLRKLLFVISEGKEPMADDTLYAFAIEEGLLQLCLQLVVIFKNSGDGEALAAVEKLLGGALQVMFNEQPAKAIANVYPKVVVVLKTPSVREIEEDKLVKTVLHILGMNIETLNKTIGDGGYVVCAQCDKNLEAEGVAMKRCGGCKKVTYCGVECQKKHWPVHKKLCREKIVNPDTHVSVDLGAEGIAKEKVASHSENVLQAAQKIFNNKVKSFLMEANAADLQIMDCIVVIDFRHHLPKTFLLTPSEFFVNKHCFGEDGIPEQAKAVVIDFHKKFKARGDLFGLCLAYPPRDKPLASGRESVAMTPAPFPGDFMPGGWPAYQAKLKQDALWYPTHA